jgi:hypothetical protein
VTNVGGGPANNAVVTGMSGFNVVSTRHPSSGAGAKQKFTVAFT